jgi:hypothetical protein
MFQRIDPEPAREAWLVPAAFDRGSVHAHRVGVYRRTVGHAPRRLLTSRIMSGPDSPLVLEQINIVVRDDVKAPKND